MMLTNQEPVTVSGRLTINAGESLLNLSEIPIQRSLTISRKNKNKKI